jgi:hypothetical protein
VQCSSVGWLKCSSVGWLTRDMSADVPESLTVEVDVQKIDDNGVISNWQDETRLWLSFNEHERTIAISGNRAALTSVARHLLTLAQPDAQPGSNLYWEPESGWFETDEAGLHISLAE